MSKTIEGVPEFIEYDQYLALFASCGVDPKNVVEMRMANDGIHVLVFALDEHGMRRYDMQHDGTEYKHRIFIPLRRTTSDARTARITPVTK